MSKVKFMKRDLKFQWIGEGIPFQRRGTKIRYLAFGVGDLKVNIGDFVLVRNDDALDPEDVMTSYVAQVKDLFDSGNKRDPYQAQVQWFSKIPELPSYAIKSLKDLGYDCEVVLDQRSSWHDVIDAETIFQKCEVVFENLDCDFESVTTKYYDHPLPVFICRYAFTGLTLTSVMNDKYKQEVAKNTSSSDIPNGGIDLNGFANHAIKKESDTLVSDKDCKPTYMNGFMHEEEVEQKSKIAKNKSNKTSSLYCTLPVGNSKYPKVIIKKIDDRVLDNKNGSVRIYVADTSVDKVTDAFIEKLRLNKKDICNSNLERRPIIHTLSSKNEVLEQHTLAISNKIEDCDSVVEPKVRRTPRSKKSTSSYCETPTKKLSSMTLRNSPAKVLSKYTAECTTPQKSVKLDDLCVSPTKNLSSMTLRNSPAKVLSKYTTECTTPQKKVKLDDLCVTRSGRKVKSVNYSENGSDMGSGRKVTFSKSTEVKKKMPNFVHSSSDDDSDISKFSASEESSSDDASLSDGSLSSIDKQKPLSRKKKSPRKTLFPRKSLSKKNVSLCIPDRKTPLKTPQNSLEESRQRLHVSAVPDSLPCREEEYSDIYNFVKGCLFAKTGGCMYISGVPGTGKTATVHEVMRNLEEEKELGEVPIFTFVEVNGMWMTDPYQCYVQIFKALTGKNIAPQQAADLLEKRFTEPGPKKDAVVLLVDELDRLWTRKQTVMYNIFDWPTKKNSKLVVLAIANTMDLPERMMMNRISSRLGLTRRTFQPYNFKQLQEIIMSRIQELKVFDPDAVQLVARKVAAVSGDARRALDICRFAAEIVQVKSVSKKSQKVLVGMEHVDAALQQMFSSPVISAIRSSSKIAKLFFQCLLSEFNRSGLEETTLMKVHEQVVAVCRFEGYRPPNYSEISRICKDLAASHLILIDNFKNDIYMKIRLNVSSDDVSYALSKH